MLDAPNRWLPYLEWYSAWAGGHPMNKVVQNFTNMLTCPTNYNNPQPKLAKFVKPAKLEWFGHLEWYSAWVGGHPRNSVVQNFTNMLTCPTDYNNPQPKLAKFVKTANLEGFRHLDLEWYSAWAGGHPMNKVVQNFTSMLTCPTDYNIPQPKLAKFIKSTNLELEPCLQGTEAPKAGCKMMERISLRSPPRSARREMSRRRKRRLLSRQERISLRSPPRSARREMSKRSDACSQPSHNLSAKFVERKLSHRDVQKITCC